MSDIELKREYVEQLEKENATLKDEVQKWMAAVSECNTAHQNDKDVLKAANNDLTNQVEARVKDKCRDIEKNINLKDQFARCVAMLERLEWSQTQDCGARCCPMCYYSKDQKHLADCDLGNLLAKIRKESK